MRIEENASGLRFDDGGMRGLAAALVWSGLVYYVTTLKDDEIKHPSVIELARGLLTIPTFYKTQGDESSAMIRRIIKQNVDAKKQTVSSYEWSMILQSLVTSGKSPKPISLQDAIEMYNSNPEVFAHGSGSGKDRAQKPTANTAQSCSCKEIDVHTIAVVDLNVPGAKSSEAINDLCACLQFINDQAPQRAVGLLELPEIAKKTSKRGLCDEEQEIQTCLWSLRQSCDNLFLTASELGTCGRPLNDEEIQLPLSKEMLLPESLDCEADLKQAERQRPSQEATQAQKGVSRWIALLSSLVTMADNSLKGKPVIIINLTPYIEDVGVAVFNMRLREQELKGGFNTMNLFYQSVSWISKEVFGHARLGRELTDARVNRLFEHGGHKYAVDPPDLTQAEIDSIPAAKAAMVSLDEMKFEVLERVNDKMMIRSDEHRFWLAQSGDIKAIYEELRQKHADLIGYQSQHQVAALADADAASASASGSAEESPRVEMESVGKLEQEVGIDLRVSSEVANVELIKCKDNSLWLLSSITKTIAKHTVLGGYGTGQWMTQAECAEPAVPFEIPAGDRTLIQLDEATFGGEGAQGITTLSIYKLLLRAETEKSITNHRVSFLSVRRKEAVEAGQDGFDVSLKQSMVFKCCRDPRGDRGDSERITSKNFFSKLISNLPTSLLTTVRYRFERVGQNFKIQRPYVISGKSISLEKDKPLKVA
eukprot:Skav232340  [mRNA]  locus=scaffold1704:535693:541139:- [translate_table: standard]